MEIEKQEMYFVVLGRKKCDFLNFTTLSFTFCVDTFCKSLIIFIELLHMLSKYILNAKLTKNKPLNSVI